MLKEKGLPFIDMFKNYPVPFDRIKIKDIKNPNKKYSDWNIDKKTLS